MPLCGPPVVFAPRVNTAWKRKGMLDFVESVLLLNTLNCFLPAKFLGWDHSLSDRFVCLFVFK